MTAFLIVAAVLLLTAVALVAYPLIRGRESPAEDQDGEVVGLSRERLEELKQKRHSGDITESEYAEQLSDLETQLADDLQTQGQAGAPPSRGSGRWMGIAAAVFIPVLSGLLYLALGQPQALTPDPRSREIAAQDLSPSDINTMVSRLAERLRDNPDDAEGWFMLGRSYMVLNRYDEAAEAFERLRALVGDAPDILVREATARAMARGGDLSGEPARLVQHALAEQPNHAQALWMAATAAHQTGDHDTALEYYRRVEPQLEGEPLQQVRGMIQELTANRSETAADAPDKAADEAAASLRVNVSLAPALQANADDGDTVFIFARAVDGPAMPLAVVRKTVADLPLTVTLDDTQAMMPQLKLSEHARVTVAARISGSGDVAARPGDLEGESGPVATHTGEAVEVTIDRIVPEGN